MIRSDELGRLLLSGRNWYAENKGDQAMKVLPTTAWVFSAGMVWTALPSLAAEPITLAQRNSSQPAYNADSQSSQDRNSDPNGLPEATTPDSGPVRYTRPAWPGPDPIGILVANVPRSQTTCLPETQYTKHDLPLFAMFAPANHVGLTSSAQPTLYWHLGTRTACRVVFTVTDEVQGKSIFEKNLNEPTAPLAPGVQKIRVGQFGLSLKPGVLYRWSIALVTDSNEGRSTDIVVTGLIGYRAPSRGFQEKVVNGQTSPALYAEAGLWYDAMAVIHDAIEASPNGSVQKVVRASLLHQAGWTSLLHQAG